MRCRPITLLLALFCTFAATGMSAQQRKLVLVDAKTSPTPTNAYTASYALLVGVNDYPNLPINLQLHYAENDVTALRDVLVHDYGFPAANVKTLLSKEATRDAILKALNGFADKRKIKPTDRILVYFSGHGQSIALDTGGQTGFLIPYDADVDLLDVTNAAPFLNTCLKMESVWDALDLSPARHVLVIADACFSGIMAAARDFHGIDPQYLEQWLARSARQVMTASEKTKPSSEYGNLGHGAFTHVLLDELKARAARPGEIFATSELFAAVQSQVMNLTGGDQKPMLGNKSTSGEFLFITGARAPVEPKAGDVRTNPVDGAEMVYIPAGDFLMGDDDDAIRDERTNDRDNPRHTVKLSGYWMYKNPVTVSEYKKFCAATAHPMPSESEFPTGINFKPDWSKEDHPIVNVTWQDALAYSKWAGADLPTEAEWEKAARGTEGRKYPWGENWDAAKCRCSLSAFGDSGGTTAVGSYPSGASPYGCLDMAGNVFQWCKDRYEPDYWKSDRGGDPVNDTLGDETHRVVRGGSWCLCGPRFFRAALRHWFASAFGSSITGVRCVVRADSH